MFKSFAVSATLVASTIAANNGLRVRATPAPPTPTRHDIAYTFTATMYTNRSATASLHQEGTSTYAASETLGANSQPEEMIDGRTTNVVMMYSSDAGIRALNPFFNWTVCNIFDVPFIGGASDWHQMTFEESLEDLFGFEFLPLYAAAEFVAPATYADTPCDLWSYESTQPSMTETADFCVASDGVLLSANYSATQGDPDNGGIFVRSENVMTEYVNTADDSLFVVPDNKDCVDLRTTAGDLKASDAQHLTLAQRAQEKGWVAGTNSRFEGMSDEEFKQTLMPLPYTFEGKKLLTKRSSSSSSSSSSKLSVTANTNSNMNVKGGSATSRTLSNSNLPASFDSRTAWPACSPLQTVRNQGACGSCWAFGASEALSDRFCVANYDQQAHSDLVLSPEYLLTCDTDNMGCGGGLLDDAWLFMGETGLPTDDCVPYEEVNGQIDPAIPCSALQKCVASAKDTEFKLFAADSVFGVEPGNVEAMMAEIMANGPIEVGFQVFDDFKSYTSGVYSKTDGAKLMGGHAVKLIGWGTDDDNVDYWIIANSWADSWGDLGGFFYMKRGNNECGVEQTPAAGLVLGVSSN